MDRLLTDMASSGRWRRGRLPPGCGRPRGLLDGGQGVVPATGAGEADRQVVKRDDQGGQIGGEGEPIGPHGPMGHIKTGTRAFSLECQGIHPPGRPIGPLRRFWALGEERIILASALMRHLRKRTNAQRFVLSTCKTGALPLSYGPMLTHA
jgi:hypothetical protein